MTTPKPFATTAFALSDALSLLGRETVADIVGVSASTLYKACNPNNPRGLDFLTWENCLTIAALLRARAKPEWFSIAFDVEVTRRSQQLAGGGNESLERLAMAVAAEAGDVQRALFDAVAPSGDGGAAITTAEAERAVAEIDEAMERLKVMKKRLVETVLAQGAGRD